jgi:hypothetical protein
LIAATALAAGGTLVTHNTSSAESAASASKAGTERPSPSSAAAQAALSAGTGAGFRLAARGALEESDLGLIVVSTRFHHSLPGARHAALGLLERAFRLHFLCYTPEELAATGDEIGTASASLEEGLSL